MPAGAKPGERRGGRPKGIPNKNTRAIRDIAGKHGKDAIDALLKIMRDTKDTPAAARVAAAKEILDRGYGKSAQEVTGADGAELFPKKIEVVVVHP